MRTLALLATLALVSCAKAPPAPPPLYTVEPAPIPVPPITPIWNDTIPLEIAYTCPESVQAARHNSTFMHRVAYGKKASLTSLLIGPERHAVLLMPDNESLDVLYYLAERNASSQWDVNNVGLLPVIIERNTGRVLGIGTPALATFHAVAVQEQTIGGTPANCGFMRSRPNGYVGSAPNVMLHAPHARWGYVHARPYYTPYGMGPAAQGTGW